jgi:hypothetical protein
LTAGTFKRFNFLKPPDLPLGPLRLPFTGIFAHEYIGRGVKLLKLLLGTRLRMTRAITVFLAHAFMARIGTISYFYLYL